MKNWAIKERVLVAVTIFLITIGTILALWTVLLEVSADLPLYNVFAWIVQVLLAVAAIGAGVTLALGKRG